MKKMLEIKDEPGTLKIGEVHPMAHNAMAYINNRTLHPAFWQAMEAIASTALSGNRSSEIVFETLRRIRDGEPVSDRYLLGAAWFLKELDEHE